MRMEELGGVGTVSNSAIILREIYKALNICQASSDSRDGTGTEYAKGLRDFLQRTSVLADQFCYPEDKLDYKPVKGK